MSKRIYSIVAHLYGAKSLEMITGSTYSNANADSSTSNGYGCHQCIRNGWIYAVPDSQTWWSAIPTGTAYSGFCCDPSDKTDCGTAWTGTHAAGSWTSGWSSSEIFTAAEKDLAVAACPWKMDVCLYSSKYSSSETFYASAAISVNSDLDEEIGFSGSQAWTTQDSCSYHAYTWSDSGYYGDSNLLAPHFFIEPSQQTNNVATSNVKVSYIEWEGDLLNSYLTRPDYSTSPSVINDQSTYLPGEWPGINQIIADKGLSTQKTRKIPGEIIKDACTTAMYEKDNSDYAMQGWNIDFWNYYAKNYADIIMNPFHGLQYAAVKYRRVLESYNYHTWLYEVLGGKTYQLPTYNGPELLNVSATQDQSCSVYYVCTTQTYERLFEPAFGYGTYSAGHLDLTKGAKSFGTLGQDDTPQLSTYYGTSESDTFGISEGWHEHSFSRNNYMHITFLADAAHSGSETAKAKIGFRYVNAFSAAIDEFYEQPLDPNHYSFRPAPLQRLQWTANFSSSTEADILQLKSHSDLYASAFNLAAPALALLTFGCSTLV